MFMKYRSLLFLICINFINEGDCLQKSLHVKSYETCNSQEAENCANDLNEVTDLNNWANNLSILKHQDRDIVNHMKDLVRQQELNPELSDDLVIDHFQRIMAFPLQTACNVGKWIALKRWNYGCGSTHGERYLCMDNFYHDIQKNRCTIYSFGISDDYRFEKLMGSVGCKVHAYDPTIDLQSSPAKNVHFQKLGLAHFKGEMKMTVNHEKNKLSKPLPVTTLKNAIEANGDLGKEITYLKVDVESSEIKAIPEWIESGVLKNVRQIGIELHTGKIFFDKPSRAKTAKSLLKSISQLYDLGFRHISYGPNTCVGKSQDHKGQYYTFIDIVLYKPYEYS